ncbi:putative outer membrane protein pmp6 precursor [Gimesia chilikensis]|uniref:Probable pectate lyase C n=1 Tax=Gimesia chilikensis TaxID=2605989 RepID=A0A517WLV5_9PLAN|nr:choice-of-anchor Q domain-containing protein [Gimesia chilikensis]QDU06235.1 putative outer membrane protein pmp6 precursor [Gimesia chilikensis]
MSTLLWLSHLKRQFRNTQSRKSRQRGNRNHQHGSPAAPLAIVNKVETLEERTLLTAFTVLNTDNSGAGSLRDAIEQANANEGADTITFDSSLAGQTVSLTSQISISDDLTIVGLGPDQLTLDGKGSSRIFQIYDGSSGTTIDVEISGITLTNGYATSGGAIHNREQLSLVDTTLANNISIGSGGAIYNDGGSVTVENSTLNGNMALGDTSPGHGGGIYSIAGSLTMTDSDFSDNMADKTGGGIYSGMDGDLTVSQSTFARNQGQSGGGIYSFRTALNIHDSQFSENRGIADPEFPTQASEGGAVYHTSTLLIEPGVQDALITNSVFTDNHADTRGGGVQFVFGYMTIRDSLFSRNTVGHSGGGIGITLGELTVEQSTFFDNRSDANGGAIGNSGTLILSQSTLTENIAAGFGGGIHIFSQGTAEIVNSTLSGNQATIEGGGIDSSSPESLTLINSTFTGNSSARGGGLSSSHVTPILLNTIVAGNIASQDAQIHRSYTSSNSIVQDSVTGLLDPVLRDNGGPTQTHALVYGSAAINAGDNAAAADAGLITDQRGTGFGRILQGTVDIGAFETGALHLMVDTNSDVDDGDYSLGNLSLREAVKLANVAATTDTIIFDASLAGMSIVLSEELLIEDDLRIFGLGVDQLTLDGDGNSRIFNVDDSDLQNLIQIEISGLTLENGYADDGGAIRSTEDLTLDNVRFRSNQAIFKGAGIYSSDGRLTVSNADFLSNKASHGGGIHSTDSVLNVIDSSFSNNTSTDGAGVYSFQSVTTVEGSTFSENTAINIVGSPEGGGIYSESGSLTVLGSQFVHNTASVFGGGIYNVSGDYFFVSQSSFTQNSSKYGGGIYNLISDMTVSESEFIKNSATTNDGGGIYHNVNPFHEETYRVEISQSHFSENSAELFGGGICIQNGEITVSGSTFSENSAHHSGAGFYSYFATTTVENSIFEKNSAFANGGGVGNGGTLSVLNSLFTRNTNGSSGGAVYNNSTGTATISNSTISGNQSSNIGGGLYSISELPLTVINSTIVQNEARVSGGGVYSHFVSPEIINSIVAGNSAQRDYQIFGSFTESTSIIQDSIEGLLDPVLRDNGGPTKTHALLLGSAAINAGDNTVAIDAELENDQRGTGFSRVSSGTIDIGAYEVQADHVQLEFHIVDSKTATDANGEASSLPGSRDWVGEWDGYWMEIWVGMPSSVDLGIHSVTLDIHYNPTVTTATSIEYGAAFTLNQTGTIDDQNGMIMNLSAETSLGSVGTNQHALLARIRFESTPEDGIDLDLAGQSLNTQTLVYPLADPEVILSNGAIGVDLLQLDSQAQISANPYDLNDDNVINFSDLLQFATVYNQKPSTTSSEYAWFADFNQNDRIGFQDLLLFVANYGKHKSGDTPVTYPQNYPDAWNQLLTVAPAPPPLQTATTVKQSTAESLLDSTVAEIIPQLPPAQQQTLSEIDIQVVDLADETLGRAAAGTIYIDVNAAGYGWFIDATPAEHSEFSPASDLTLIALPDSEAAGLIDLRTVILHELGHLLGYEHDAAGLMQETLAPGVRYLPDWESATDEFFGSLADNTELSPF